jgi:hypothetical protein
MPVFGVVKSEIRHKGECRFKDAENLSHGRYLPFEVVAENMQIKGKHDGFRFGIYPDCHSPIIETDPGCAESEILAGGCDKL